jgi:hypothetical protein
MLDLASKIKTVAVLGPIAATTDQNGSFDRAGFESCVLLFVTGAGGITFDATNKLDNVVQHSDDNSTFTAVAAADVVITLPDGTEGAWASGGIVRSLQAAHAAKSVTKVSYIGNKRYIKVLEDFSGTHGTATPVAVVAVLGDGNIPAGV